MEFCLQENQLSCSQNYKTENGERLFEELNWSAVGYVTLSLKLPNI